MEGSGGFRIAFISLAVCGQGILGLPLPIFTLIADEYRMPQHIWEDLTDAIVDRDCQKVFASQMRVEWPPMRGHFSALLYAVIAASRYIPPYILLGRLQPSWSLGQGNSGGEMSDEQSQADG